MGYRNLKEIDIRGKSILVRVDFNVPLEEGEVRDDTRIRAALPTINYLLENSCRIILLSHLGRPKGKVVEELRMDPVAHRLAQLVAARVKKSNEWRGDLVKEELANLKNGQILLLENTRFDPGEEKNDLALAREWASLADIFVNDAFGVVHRAHSSTVGVATYLPAFPGFLLEKELSFLAKLVEGDLERPYLAILGGAKVSDKIGVIDSLLERVDSLLLGGGMANTFLAVKGWKMGASLREEDKFPIAKELLQKAEDLGKRILLPQDLLVTNDFSGQGEIALAEGTIKEDWLAVDIGPATLANFTGELKKARTVLWNGPLGVFEVPAFAKGTQAIAKAMSSLEALTLVGGGDSVAAVRETGVADSISHISTGGGATLEYLEGKELPGIIVLKDE